MVAMLTVRYLHMGEDVGISMTSGILLNTSEKLVDVIEIC